MTESLIIKGLNDKQKEAVLATDGPVLVVAGAGSGKTRALTHRIAYLIKEKGVSPWNIMAVTFTNKAAGEMRERVMRLLEKGTDTPKNSPELPTIGTFHSLCVRILRKHIHLLDYENQFTIYDASDQLVLMKHVFADLHMNEKELNPRAVLAQISNAKNRLMGPGEYASIADSYFAEKVARLYGPYQERLKKSNSLDFDDLLMKTIELFRTHPEVLDEYQEKFKYIHVDEYQDTNHAQYMLTNMLAAKYRNVCVIGDHDQAIYSWRGANIQNILDFEKDYPEAKVITMEQNYRSTQAILDAAQAVIVKNKKRKEKRLWTEQSGGDKVTLWVAENERHEAEMVIFAIKELLKSYEVPDYRDFVVLYRTNAQSRALEEVFLRYGMPYRIIGGIRFYERKEIKDLVAYLRVIANPSDEVSLLRIINVPHRSIGPKTIEYIQTFAHIKDITLFNAMLRAEEVTEIPESKRELVTKFAHMIRKMQKQNLETPASGMIKFVFDSSGYKKSLDDGSVEGEARIENMNELISVATKYDKLEAGLSLNIFLEEIALIADVDSMEEKDNSVTLMTLHSVKGLEFPYVFICGLEDGLLPHSRAMLSPEELEEERRLFYVGCTRAMEKLFLLHTKNRMLYGESHEVIPSQFILDIPEELMITNTVRKNALGQRIQGGLSMKSGDIGKTPIPEEKPMQEYSDGDRVSHRTFGEGIVVSVTGGIITVAFKDPKVGIKKLAISIAPLEKI